MGIIDYLRQFRIAELAVFDFVVAFLGIYLLSPWLSRLFLKIGVEIPKTNWLYLTLPIGMVTHLLTGRITPLTSDFFDLDGHFFIKLLILVLVILGLRGIKIKKKKKPMNKKKK